MRVSEQQIFGPLLANLQRARERLMAAQGSVSSGKRLTRPSDDPLAFRQIISDNAKLKATEQRLRNLQLGAARLQVAEGALGQVITLLSRVKELAVGASNGTKTAADRATIAQDVRQLHRQLLQLANTTEANGEAVFAGTKTNQSPFVLGTGDTVSYAGNSETQAVEVGSGQTIQVTLPGSQVFTGPTINIFDKIKDLLTALETNNGAGIQQGIGDLDQAITQVTNAQGQIGALANRLESTKAGLEQLKEIVTTTLSQSQDADLAKAISDLALHQVAAEAAAQVASRIFESTLLRFLR